MRFQGYFNDKGLMITKQNNIQELFLKCVLIFMCKINFVKVLGYKLSYLALKIPKKSENSKNILILLTA